MCRCMCHCVRAVLSRSGKCVSSLLLCMWCACVFVCGDSNEMFDDRCDLQSRLQQKTSTRHCIMHRSSLHVHCSMCRRSCSMSSVSGSLTTLGHLFINGSRSLSPHFEFREKIILHLLPKLPDGAPRTLYASIFRLSPFVCSNFE